MLLRQPSEVWTAAANSKMLNRGWAKKEKHIYTFIFRTFNGILIYWWRNFFMFFISCRAYLKMSSDSQIHCNETWRRGRWAALLWLDGLIFCFYMNSWRRRVPNCWPSALASQGSGLKSTWRGETDFYTFNSSIDVFHQSPVIYFSFQLKLVKCAEAVAIYISENI